MQKFSALTLAKEALSGQKGWDRQWRDAAPKPAYEAIIVALLVWTALRHRMCQYRVEETNPMKGPPNGI